MGFGGNLNINVDVDSAVDAVKEAAASAVDTVADAAEDVVSAVKTAADEAIASATAAAAEIKGQVDGAIAQGTAAVNGAVSAAGEIREKVVEVKGSINLESGVKITTGQLNTFLIPLGRVHVVRLIGLIFDANKCFLLPYALGGIKKIVTMHKRYMDGEVLIIGHDGSDEHFNGVEIACARAEMLAAYLANNADPWLAWFGTDKPLSVRWGTREIQLMLSVLPEEGKPFFLGNASGITNEKTIESIKAFQNWANSNMGCALVVDGKAGPDTREQLIRAYMGVQDTSFIRDITPVAHGCEGQFEEDLIAVGMEPDDRVIEVFFFEKKIKPKPKDRTARKNMRQYTRWKKQIIDAENFQYHGVHVQIVDSQKKPVRFAQVTLDGPEQFKTRTDDQGFAFISGLTEGTYTVTAEKAGMTISTSTLTYPTAKTVLGTFKRAQTY